MILFSFFISCLSFFCVSTSTNPTTEKYTIKISKEQVKQILAPPEFKFKVEYFSGYPVDLQVQDNIESLSESENLLQDYYKYAERLQKNISKAFDPPLELQLPDGIEFHGPFDFLNYYFDFSGVLILEDYDIVILKGLLDIIPMIDEFSNAHDFLLKLTKLILKNLKKNNSTGSFPNFLTFYGLMRFYCFNIVAKRFYQGSETSLNANLMDSLVKALNEKPDDRVLSPKVAIKDFARQIKSNPTPSAIMKALTILYPDFFKVIFKIFQKSIPIGEKPRDFLSKISPQLEPKDCKELMVEISLFTQELIQKCKSENMIKELEELKAFEFDSFSQLTLEDEKTKEKCIIKKENLFFWGGLILALIIFVPLIYIFIKPKYE